jgi:hypothetical protein
VVRTFLVECYWPGVTEEAYLQVASRVLEAAGRSSESGAPVRFLDSLFMPGDEAVFLRFESESRTAVEQMCERAGVRCDRVVEYVGGTGVVEKGMRGAPGDADSRS